MTIVGSGDFRFERVAEWPKPRRYFQFSAPSDAAVNPDGEIYVLSRRDRHPVTIWSKDGEFIYCWGEGEFSDQPHGIYIAPNGNVWIVDRDYHIASEYTPGGERIRTLGRKLEPSPTWEGRFIQSKPFNMPTNLAIAGNGDIFVADGYGNHRVHKFNSDGELLLSWGKQGTGPGEFALVHNIWIDRDERVLVADDENHRIQIFNTEGVFLDEWKMTNPSGLCIHRDIVYVGQLGPYHDRSKGEGWGSVSLWGLDGSQLASWTGLDSPTKDLMVSPHDLCVDDDGSVYVCEVDIGRVSKYRRV
jgi:DNA-binding beta-propeller fold protein YncE